MYDILHVGKFEPMSSLSKFGVGPLEHQADSGNQAGQRPDRVWEEVDGEFS